MFKVLELSGLFVCPGDLFRFSVPGGGIEETAGLWFSRGDQYPGWHYPITNLCFDVNAEALNTFVFN